MRPLGYRTVEKGKIKPEALQQLPSIGAGTLYEPIHVKTNVETYVSGPITEHLKALL